MKTSFQQFQQRVQQHQQRQRWMAGGYYATQQRCATSRTSSRSENLLVWLLKLPFRLIFLLLKMIITLAVIGLFVLGGLALLSVLLS